MCRADGKGKVRSCCPGRPPAPGEQRYATEALFFQSVGLRNGGVSFVETGGFVDFREAVRFFLTHKRVSGLLKDSYEREGNKGLGGFISYTVGELGVGTRVSLASIASFITRLVFT